MRQPKDGPSATLLSAFLFCLIGVACVFIALVSIVWFYSSTMLEREQEMAFDLLPSLDAAHKLTSATAGLQSQGLLLSIAKNTQELDLRREQLDDTMLHVRESSALLELESSEEQVQLIGEISSISSAIMDLQKSKAAELRLQGVIENEKLSVLMFLQQLEKTMQAGIVTVGNELLVASDVMTQFAPSGTAFADSDDVPNFAQQMLTYDKGNLELQDYLLMIQDLVSLAAIVERLPLLNSSTRITQAAQNRDLLFSALIARTIYISDKSVSAGMIASIRELRARLGRQDGLFAMQVEALLRRESQLALNDSLSLRTTRIFEITDSLRSVSSDSVNSLAVLTLNSVRQYRFQLLGISFLAMLVLAAVGYWLLYRRTVQPIVDISQRISDVGSERFPKHRQHYFLSELNTLSAAVAQLDMAQKGKLEQEYLMKQVNNNLLQANEELQQFAHVASHDLQEPLRKMRQFSDLLEEDYGSVIEGDGRYYLDSIRGSSQRMSDLIRATLAYSRSGSANQVYELVDLNVVLKDVWDEMELAVADAQGQLHVDTLPKISANAMGVSQLFRNLLLNALKYRRPGTSAKIEVSVSDVQGELPRMISIRVQDNGIGIEEQYLDRIFTPFERFHIGGVVGTGLGLSICKKVCNAHGWELLVSSELGVGTSFDVRIPAGAIEQR